MALGGKVDDGTGAMLLEGCEATSSASQMSPRTKRVAGIALERSQVGGIAGVGQEVKIDDGASRRPEAKSRRNLSR